MHDRTLVADDVVIMFVDLQEGIVNVAATNDAQRLRRAVAALADLAVAFELPVIASCVPTTGGTIAPLLTEISARLPGTVGLLRATSSIMDDAALTTALRDGKRATLIIAGVATEVAVRLAALDAHRAGYHAIVAVDACSGLDERTESTTFMHLGASGIELSNVAAIAASLAGDFVSERGRAAMRAFQSLLVVPSHEHHDTHEHAN